MRATAIIQTGDFSRLKEDWKNILIRIRNKKVRSSVIVEYLAVLRGNEGFICSLIKGTVKGWIWFY